jgi:hypothetical protein
MEVYPGATLRTMALASYKSRTGIKLDVDLSPSPRVPLQLR